MKDQPKVMAAQNLEREAVRKKCYSLKTSCQFLMQTVELIEEIMQLVYIN